MSVSSKLSMVVVLALLAESEPSWLARALARTDPDVDAAIVAYEGEDYDLALEHLDAAVARRGERAELAYDRGLALLAKADKEGARTAFQRGTESDTSSVVASSRYQLGNLALLDEDWETAIHEYTACLREQPDHQNAKWNLEIALLRKKEQEKKEQEQKEQEQQDEQNEDQKNEDEQNQDQKNDEQQQDEQQQDEQQQDEQQQDEQKQDEQQGEQKQDEQKQDEQKQDEQEPKPQPEQQPVEAKPIESGDLDGALEQLDRQDQFMLGRPRGSRRPVAKDW